MDKETPHLFTAAASTAALIVITFSLASGHSFVAKFILALLFLGAIAPTVWLLTTDGSDEYVEGYGDGFTDGLQQAERGRE